MQAFGEIGERLRRSTVQIFSGGRDRGSGSGVIWSAGGLIITNAHVVRSAQAQVELWDGRRADAHVTAHDARRDLAALSIAVSDLPAATVGDSAALRSGELVIAAGNPFGFAGALSTGVVYSVATMSGMGRQNWVVATARLAPGNSGGPLANAQGEVVGINTAIVNGLGLAVPSCDVGEFLRRGSRPKLGVSLRPVAYDGSRLGLLLLGVEPNGPADRASLQVGDILVGVGGRELESLDSLYDALDSGVDAVRLAFLRGDRRVVREAVVQVRVRAEAA
jgi:serine protease Do